MNPMQYGAFKDYIKHFKGVHHFEFKKNQREKDYKLIENRLLE